MIFPKRGSKPPSYLGWLSIDFPNDGNDGGLTCLRCSVCVSVVKGHTTRQIKRRRGLIPQKSSFEESVISNTQILA